MSYVCADCEAKEEIPQDMLEYFDDIDPEQLLYGAHEFVCVKCETGIMKPENESEIIIKGYGLHEGLNERLVKVLLQRLSQKKVMSEANFLG